MIIGIVNKTLIIQSVGKDVEHQQQITDELRSEKSYNLVTKWKNNVFFQISGENKNRN